MEGVLTVICVWKTDKGPLSIENRFKLFFMSSIFEELIEGFRL